MSKRGYLYDRYVLKKQKKRVTINYQISNGGAVRYEYMETREMDLVR